MAYKVLGQSAPSATTATDVYTVTSGKSAVVSTITVCNRGTTGTTYRISARPAGATQTNAMYLVYDATIPANSTVPLTLGVTLASTDVLTVYAGNGNLSFNVFGNES